MNALLSSCVAHAAAPPSICASFAAFSNPAVSKLVKILLLEIISVLVPEVPINRSLTASCAYVRVTLRLIFSANFASLVIN